MKLKTFKCASLNGFLDQEIHFYNDVSFLHGINGSGKTTILRAITSILTPDLQWLVTANYNVVELVIEQDDKEYHIEVQKFGDVSIKLLLSGSLKAESVFSIIDVLNSITAEPHTKYFGILNLHSNTHQLNERSIIEGSIVLKFIRDLPSPIFLGLDRTTLLSGIVSSRITDAVRESSAGKSARTVLDDALEQAVDIVTKRMSAIAAERNKIYSDVQTKLVLSLFNFETKDEPKLDFDISSLNTNSINEISKIQSNVISGLRKIKIANSDIDRLVTPFFKEAELRAKSAFLALEDRRNNRDRIKSGEWYEAVDAWFKLSPYLNIVSSTLKILQQANIQEEKIFAAVVNYKSTIDSFIGDSGKSIEIDDEGVKIILPNGSKEAVKILSSGERQIFVLITHLAMNLEMQKTNVLIVDEPELSLHLKWQKQFVRAVQKVSPRTQIILATHSPEIINNMTSKAISLS